MHRFWKRYVSPLIEAAQPRRLLEVGAEFGWNTRGVLDYCRRTGARLDVIDTVPLRSLLDTLAPYPEEAALHARKSLDAIPELAPADFVLLDGDHNWRTVYAEMTALYARASAAGAAAPIVVAHDCAWPYARRDMYYAPDEWLEADRQPYAYRGVRQGSSELVDDGLNGHFANALHEGGPENGVLTALEDFVASRGGGVTLRVLPFFNGLGIVLPDARRTPEVDAVVEGFFTPDALLEACRALEADGMGVRAEMIGQQKLLTQRTEALQRARAMLAERAARIAELEAELAAREAPAQT